MSENDYSRLIPLTPEAVRDEPAVSRRERLQAVVRGPVGRAGLSATLFATGAILAFEATSFGEGHIWDSPVENAKSLVNAGQAVIEMVEKIGDIT